MIKENTTISGKPNFIAVRGVQALDVEKRVVWEQKTSPYGNSWQIVKKNVDIDTDYVSEGENKYVTPIQKTALNEANEPSFENPFATLRDISTTGLGNVWWVKSNTIVTVEDNRENVVTEMVIDGELILDGKLTVL